MDDLLRRLRDPAFGTETSERSLMAEAANRIAALERERNRLAALFKEAHYGVCRARLSLSQAAKDFHAQQADDLLFYVAARLEVQEQVANK